MSSCYLCSFFERHHELSDELKNTIDTKIDRERGPKFLEIKGIIKNPRLEWGEKFADFWMK